VTGGVLGGGGGGLRLSYSYTVGPARAGSRPTGSPGGLIILRAGQTNNLGHFKTIFFYLLWLRKGLVNNFEGACPNC